jgi:serine/threonine protein phosphatase PrpC
LVQAFVAANQEIVRQAQTHEEWNGMGTTCVCALIINDHLHVANIGDSRLYLIRDHQIYQLTYDHTWLEELSKLDIQKSGRSIATILWLMC